MKSSILTVLILLFLGFAFEAFPQKAKLEANKESILANISAVSNEEVFTDGGNFKFSEINGIFFEKYDPVFLSIYSKLQIKVPVKFGDGSPLVVSDSTEFQPKDQNAGQADLKKSTTVDFKSLQNLKDSPENHLIKASKSGLTGIGLSFLGILVSAVGASEGNEGITIAGLVVSAAGIAYIVDGWSKIGDAGKAMKAERELEKQDKEK